MEKDFVWQKASPESEGMSGSELDAMRDSLAARGTKTLLIVRHDKIVYEWYAPDYNADKLHYTASLAKALVGGVSLMIAMNDGRIGVDDPAWKYVPAWKDHPQKSKITIRHLATHSSGIEDAEEGELPHEKLPGWKGAFWRREPDPFTIARDQAPVIFPPGSKYAYSNPGMAMLAYTVTASLKSAPESDIRTLLRERIMRPIGVPDAAWSMGYGKTYDVDGLKLCANWGGGGYTARAVASVGRLMLRKGNWDGKQLVAPEWVEKVIAYAGTPFPSRPAGNPQPASGLGWYTNFDGGWPSVPRDAFAGAGAGNQVLLVIPSLDLIIVRNGALIGRESEGLGFWGGMEKFLFNPVVAAVKGKPQEHPQSPVIKDVKWDSQENIIRKAAAGGGDGSDNWPLTWADDGNLYTAYGDGRGFDPMVPNKLGLGFARVIGDPPDFTGENIRSDGENTGSGKSGKKASGLLMVDGVLYMLVRNADNQGNQCQLAWSRDHAKTWTWSDWKFTEFGYMTFINFGRNYSGVPDKHSGYVYMVSHDNPNAYDAADQFILARVPVGKITEKSACEFFKGLDPENNPIWTKDVQQRGAVLKNPGLCRRSGISFNAGLKRYLWWQQRHYDKADTRFDGGFSIYDAPEPWGPWTMVYYTNDWDVGPGETASFPTKWMSADGKTCYLVFSGNDNFSVRKVEFILASETVPDRMGYMDNQEKRWKLIANGERGLCMVRIIAPEAQAHWDYRIPEALSCDEGVFKIHDYPILDWKGPDSHGAIWHEWQTNDDDFSVINSPKNAEMFGLKFIQGIRYRVSIAPSENGLELLFAATNISDQEFHNVIAFPCLGFPSENFRDNGLERTFILTEKGLTALKVTGRGTVDPRRTHYIVQNRRPIRYNLESFWGKASQTRATSGLIMRTRADGKFTIAADWKTVCEIYQNEDDHHCIHSVPTLGDLKPGETKTVHGRIVLIAGGPEDMLKELGISRS